MKTRYLSIVLLLSALFLHLNCGNNSSKLINYANPEFSKYIGAFTSGIISRASTLKIQLTSDIAAKLDKAMELDADLFETKPRIKGSVKWLDDRTLELTPKEQLRPNTGYLVKFNLGDLTKVEDKLEQFVFEVHTLQQNFAVDEVELKIPNNKIKDRYKLVGNLVTADVEDFKKVQKLLTATLDNSPLQVKWNDDTQNKRYAFEIDSITRSDKSRQLSLQWNGEPIDVENSGSMELTVPESGNFTLMSNRIVNQPQQYVQLTFSEPVDEFQNLNGLIQISGLSNLQYEVSGNTVRVFTPYQLSGTYTLSVASGIKNTTSGKMKNDQSVEVTFDEVKPAVRMSGKGFVLPTSDQGLVLPFEAVNLKAVDVTVVRIYENNVTQFLQVNGYQDNYELRRVGIPVLKTTLSLQNANSNDLGRWTKFSLELSKLMQPEPGAIYNIKLGFKQEYSLYSCSNQLTADNSDMKKTEDDWNSEDEESNWDNYETYYNDWWGDDDYWSNTENPCHRAYYGEGRSVWQNVLASNIGVIAKRGGDNEINVFVTDLLSAKATSGAEVEILNYQNQVLAKGKTDGNGQAHFDNVKTPYFVVVKKGDERGYLKLYDGNALSYSQFSVQGESVNKGLKGYIYGERGVWRPGDSLYLTFVLDDHNNPLPDQHPIVLEIKNPSGQVVTREVTSKNNTGFYSFFLKTDANAPTGNWTADIKAGGATFTKTLKIETIVPNRLKIEMDFGKKQITRDDGSKTELSVHWLHGAVGRNLTTTIETVLQTETTTFDGYELFTFDDHTKEFYTQTEQTFYGSTDNDGKAVFEPKIDAFEQAPGKLKATFITKVYEPGSGSSTDQYSITYSPYTSYVGVRLPKGDAERGMLLTDTSHIVELVTLDTDGKPMTQSRKLEVSFYKLSWQWWWDQSYDNVADFSSSNNIVELKKETIETQSGKALWNIRVNYPDWGRYLVRVYDPVSLHSASKVVYIDWPGWAGRAQNDDMTGSTMLRFTTDKSKYNVGETVTVNIPATNGNGRALISIENGTKVLSTQWLATKTDNNVFKFDVTRDMTPNVYVNVTLVQPHAQTANDLPMRMYGAIPIMVEDKNTLLEPIIQMPDKLESETSFDVTVSEKEGKEMTYTIAVVDEGLLGLTRFKTPNPWNAFYAREALGVRTWDIFDMVVGAHNGALDRLLSIGGDDELGGGDKAKQANRFVPVVKFLGPFKLNSGSRKHTINLPRYIGAVRTMVVAGNGKAYGCAEKSVPVIKPLMVLATLPRVVSSGEKVKLPVSLFVMDDNIKEANIKLTTNEMFEIKDGDNRQIGFSKQGEQYATFELEVKNATGIGKVSVVATSGAQRSQYDIEIDVRNPNVPMTRVLGQVVEAGQTWQQNVEGFGIAGSNTATLEISSIPAINLQKRLKYLIEYPHGCIEQTTSAAFPQLFAADLSNASDDQKRQMADNVKMGIKRIASFQMGNGGFSYWQGGTDADQWGSNYAGHFLIEAKQKGFTVPNDVLSKWATYQKTRARNWNDDGTSAQLTQAYRLYTLALMGDADMSSMNRLRSVNNLTNDAKWHLAAAYALAGKKQIANQLVEKLNFEVAPYSEMDYTYGSDLRDKAIILESLIALDREKDAFGVLSDIAAQLGSDKWISTHSTAYALVAVSRFVSKNGKPADLKFSWRSGNGNFADVTSSTVVHQIKIDQKGNLPPSVEVKNNGSAMIFVRLINEGVPAAGDEVESENRLKLKVYYTDADGKTLDVDKLPQSTIIYAVAEITNPSGSDYRQMALTQAFPSGWEINNKRLYDITDNSDVSIPTYYDVRDDRVLTYFNLQPAETKKFKVSLNASYLGKFYLPAVYAEAMYDGTINASNKGRWVSVTKAN